MCLWKLSNVWEVGLWLETEAESFQLESLSLCNVLRKSLVYVAGCCTSCAVRVKSGQLRQPEALGISAELKSKVNYNSLFTCGFLIHHEKGFPCGLQINLSTHKLCFRACSEILINLTVRTLP